MLVVLYGPGDSYEEQKLEVFDIPSIFHLYPQNIVKKYKVFSDLSGQTKFINLPNLNQKYFSLKVVGKELVVYSQKGQRLKKYSLNKL